MDYDVIVKAALLSNSDIREMFELIADSGKSVVVDDCNKFTLLKEYIPVGEVVDSTIEAYITAGGILR